MQITAPQMVERGTAVWALKTGLMTDWHLGFGCRTSWGRDRVPPTVCKGLFLGRLC